MPLVATTKRTSKRRYHGIENGYRSGLEEKLSEQLDHAGIGYEYEGLRIIYTVPTRSATYTPDFWLSNGIIIESKGRLLPADRKKHLLIKEQHPHYDIRFVFTRSATPITKGSKTTYADWCRKHGFKFADKSIPEAWLREQAK